MQTLIRVSLRRLFPVATIASVIVLVFGAAAADEPKAPSKAMLGKKVPNLTFTTESGKRLSLYDLKGSRAIVVVFLSFDCPVSNSYAKPLADIHERFHEHGVSILGVTTNEDQTPAEVARLAREFKLPFPVVVDYDFKAADALQANVTPEVFVLDGNFVLRYRGRIDNAYYARLKRNHEVSCHDLHQALGELMSGRPVSNPATEAIGCAIQRDLKNVASDGPVTFYRDVLPILQKNCQQCHRPGEVGQFSLLTYRQAVNWAQDIKHYTKKGVMPPWKVTDGLPLHDERKLTAKEIETLAKWVDGKTPMGDPQDAPEPVTFTEGWQLGQPDLVLTVPDDFQLGPEGKDVFRCFVLPTNLTEDKYVSAVEVRPGNPRVVHHTLQFIDTTGQGRRLEQREKEGRGLVRAHDPAKSLDKGPGYSVTMGVGFTPQGGLGGWAPGMLARHLPEGYGYFLPKGSDVILQVHYHRNGRTEKDRTKIGIYFASSKDTRPYQGGIIAGGRGGKGPLRLFFAIPAGDPNFKLTGSIWAEDDCKIYSITPHMHMLGKSIKVTMTPPGGDKITLLEIKDWDYNWQEVYFLKEPLAVQKGARLDVEAVYDNSANNRNNPFSPPRIVTFGEETTNEMCFVFLGGSSARAGRRLPLTPNRPAGDTTTKTANE